MTPTTVRMVLVEGENADGVTVDHDVFDVAVKDGSANVAGQVVSAVLGTRESALAGGHHLKSIGVTWSDHAEAAALRDALAVDGIDDVILVSEGHAAAALAQAVGRAVGYDRTGLLFVDRDSATLSVVQTEDGSVVKVLGRTLHSADAMAVLAEMAEAVAAHRDPPQGLFVVGSGVEVNSVKAHLEHLVSLPVNAPEDAELALARGAALASATAPTFEASTVGLAYSQDPDGATAGSLHSGPAGAETPLASVVAQPVGGLEDLDDDLDEVVDEYAQTQLRAVEEERKPFLLVGSALTSVFVIGVVALAISLAVSIRPTADQRPSPAESVIVPSSQVPMPVQEAREPVNPPPAETIEPPIPVVQQVPAPTPRTVFVEAPAPAAPAPAPVAPPPVVPPPVVAPPVVVPPPVIVPPQPRWQWPQWTQWTPPVDSFIGTPDDSQVPQFPQMPQVPQVPQQPQVPGNGSGGSGSGSNPSGSGAGADYGSGAGTSGSGSGGGYGSSGSSGSSGSGSSSGGSTGSVSGSPGIGSSPSGASGSGGSSPSPSGSGASSPGGGSGVSSPSAGSTSGGSVGGGGSGVSSPGGSTVYEEFGRGSGGFVESGSSRGSRSSGGSSGGGDGPGGGGCFLIFCSSG